MIKQLILFIILYSAKFSRPHSFRVFRGWHRTSKIKLRKILEYLIDAHMR